MSFFMLSRYILDLARHTWKSYVSILDNCLDIAIFVDGILMYFDVFCAKKNR